MQNDTPDESTYVERARKGDMGAFGQLVQMYQHRLYNALIRMVGSADDALEICQEAFLRALQAIKKFRGQAGFYTWLYRIGFNLAINHRRKKKTIDFTALRRETDDDGRQADGLRHLIDPAASPPEQTQLRDEHRRALAALMTLDEDARAIIILRDIEQFNYAEIAAILELPAGTVKSRLCRARLALREKLTAQERSSRVNV